MSCQASKSLPPSATLQTSEKVMQSIVKLFVQLSTPNYSMPWQMKRQQQTFGSGFVIRDHYILTNAHVVAYQKSIRVRKHGDSRKYAAKVLYVGHECDIALITVQEDEFWQDLTPLEFGGIPMLEQDVVVVGFPTGGDNISVTRGVVSRVELQRYAHSGVELLAIQIDAAINAGNSGGPALQDGKVVGIAFEALDNAENIGYIIPTPTIQHFLADVGRNNRFSGFCHLGIKWQAIESDHMRAYYCMAVEDTGVLVSTVQKLSCSFESIKRGDVLMTFDGNNIADDGTIPFRRQERILWDFLVHYKFPGDSVEVTVLRAGKRMCLTIRLDLPHHLVPVQMYDRRPSYVVFCGLVFIALSQPYMQHQYGKDWGRKAPIRLCDRILYGVQEKEGQEVIVLSQVLADELTAGYDHFANLQLYRVNGIPILNLRHLCDVLDALSQPHLTTVPKERQEIPSLPSANSSQVEDTENKEVYSETGEVVTAVLESGKNHVISSRDSAYTSFECLDHILLEHSERLLGEDGEQITQSGGLTEICLRQSHPLEEKTVTSGESTRPSQPWAPRPSSLYSGPSQAPLILDRINYAHFELDKDKVIVLSLPRSLRKRNDLLRQYAISQARSSDLPPPP